MPNVGTPAFGISLLVWLISYSVRPQTQRILPLIHHAGADMRKFLLGTAALIALVCPAISADMRAPVYKAPPPVVPTWSWTGCYVGGHADNDECVKSFHWSSPSLSCRWGHVAFRGLRLVDRQGEAPAISRRVVTRV